jgi:hypothetical protein
MALAVMKTVRAPEDRHCTYKGQQKNANPPRHEALLVPKLPHQARHTENPRKAKCDQSGMLYRERQPKSDRQQADVDPRPIAE